MHLENQGKRNERPMRLHVEDLCTDLRIVQHCFAAIVDADQHMLGGCCASAGIDDKELPRARRVERILLKVRAYSRASGGGDLSVRST